MSEANALAEAKQSPGPGLHCQEIAASLALFAKKLKSELPTQLNQFSFSAGSVKIPRFDLETKSTHV